MIHALHALDGWDLGGAGAYRAAFEAAGVGLCVVGPHDEVLAVNDRWLRSSGLSREAALGRELWELFPGTPPELRRLHDEARAGRAVAVPPHLQVIAGRATWFQGQLAPLPLPGGVGVLITAVDVTEQRRAEEALAEADRRKTEFLAVLSHELRNPLAPIHNALFLLENAPHGSAAAQHAREVLERQAHQLSRLVDDLLDISRVTHGKIEVRLERLDARELVRRAHADALALFEDRDVALALALPPEPLWVDADGARLSQMLGNLLHNALKFTPPRGQVGIAAERRGDACVVTVRDTGVGLEADELERIFDPFVQAGRAGRAGRGHGGLGLGLALVRALAAKHGGAVHAESPGPGQGAAFVLELPLAPPPAEAPAPAPVARAAGMSVLVVEDNEDAAATLADLLALTGHRVRTAPTGRAGLEALAAARPDLLVCDVGLPDMSGHDVIRQVRAAEAGSHLFALALTGYAQPQDRDEALAAGFDAHLPKPPPFEELQLVLARAAAARAIAGAPPG